ncbi:MAG TPA: DUF3224 domain-containing protein [Candidatus Baltobacteraceae bacterium]|nr:DUF3224 domain-containing protein [Candidatus Baltobacteraceae bacterium]
MNERQRRTRAVAKVTVQSAESEPYDQTANPALMEIRIAETFAGDLDGESIARSLQFVREDRTAGFVSMQRFRGRLGAREGTFVLQGRGSVENGRIEAAWFVVPDSGTQEFSGLRGEGGFEGDFGQGSDATLDYWFE